MHIEWLGQPGRRRICSRRPANTTPMTARANRLSCRVSGSPGSRAAPTRLMNGYNSCLRVDADTDANALTARALRQDLLLAPGSLFSPSQQPSTRMRLNLAALQDPAVWRFLETRAG